VVQKEFKGGAERRVGGEGERVFWWLGRDGVYTLRKACKQSMKKRVPSHPEGVKGHNNLFWKS